MSILETPLDAIVFDCDGTLSRIEGIDVLAEENGVGTRVSALTADAMGKTGLTVELYEKRLALTAPTLGQVQKLGQRYFDERTPDIISVIDIFQKLGKAVYVVSAGLLPAVSFFAQQLHIPEKNVFAVDIYFDTKGHYVNFDHASPLVCNDGKRVILEKIKQRHPRIAFIGDGLNDVAAKNSVTQFIGFGGFYYRENIEKQCAHYIKDASMRAILHLCLTKAECAQY